MFSRLEYFDLSEFQLTETIQRMEKALTEHIKSQVTFIYLSVCPCICLSITLSICLFTYLFIYLSKYLSVYLSTFLFKLMIFLNMRDFLSCIQYLCVYYSLIIVFRKNVIKIEIIFFWNILKDVRFLSCYFYIKQYVT